MLPSERTMNFGFAFRKDFPYLTIFYEKQFFFKKSVLGNRKEITYQSLSLRRKEAFVAPIEASFQVFGQCYEK